MTLSKTEGAHDIRTVSPGLRGYYYRMADGRVTVPAIHADTPGSGDCQRFLNALPRDEHIMFVCVLSPVLAGMLLRRGFVPAPLWLDEMEEWDFDCWQRPIATNTNPAEVSP